MIGRRAVTKWFAAAASAVWYTGGLSDVLICQKISFGGFHRCQPGLDGSVTNATEKARSLRELKKSSQMIAASSIVCFVDLRLHRKLSGFRRNAVGAAGRGF
jgi:hypothetical protein